MHMTALIDWNSARDMKKCARHVQRNMMKALGFWGVIHRYRAAQSGLVPTQQKILEGLNEGLYQEFI